MNKKLMVITGPSASGKTYVEKLSESTFGSSHIQTATTRSRRSDDAEDQYLYKSSKEFSAGVDAGEFIEHAVYGGNSYGTPVSSVDSVLFERNQHGTLVVDKKGAYSIGRYFSNRIPKYKDVSVICIILKAEKSILTERLLRRTIESQDLCPKPIAELSKDITNRLLDINNFEPELTYEDIKKQVSIGFLGYSDVLLLDTTVSSNINILNKLKHFFKE